MAYVPLRKAVKELGLHPNTLRKYADTGKILTIKNEAGQRLYDIEAYISGEKQEQTVLYARVSSYKQKDDLKRQISYLTKQYPDGEVIKDIGGGLNFNRKGFKAILERLMSGDKLQIIVAHKKIFGDDEFNILLFLVSSNNGSVLVLEDFI